jgi:hypothetical protein
MDKQIQTLIRNYEANPGDLDGAQKLITALRRIHDGVSAAPDLEDEDDEDYEYHPPIKITLSQLEDALAHPDVRLENHIHINDGKDSWGSCGPYIVQFNESEDLDLEALVALARILNIKHDRIEMGLGSSNSSCHCHPEYTHFVELTIPKEATPAIPNQANPQVEKTT